MVVCRGEGGRRVVDVLFRNRPHLPPTIRPKKKKRNPHNVPSSILPNTYYPAVSGFVAEQNGRWKVFLSHDVVEKNKNRTYLDPILSTGIRKSKNADVGT